MDTITRPELSVTLTMTPQLAAELQRETGALDLARAYLIDSPDMAEAANGELKARKAAIVRLKELKAGFVRPAKEIIANAEALFDPAIEANEEAEKILKTSLLAYTTEQQRLADEARRKREEEERHARQKAEAEAAAARARAEEQAREQARIAREAEERRQKAEAEGNARAAAAAAAEAAKAAQKAADAIENGEAKAQEAILTAAAAPAAPVAEAPKLDGFSMRDNWTAEIAPGHSDGHTIMLIAKAITDGRVELAGMLKLDMSAAGKLAKALKGAFNVPGMVAVNRPVAASRK